MPLVAWEGRGGLFELWFLVKLGRRQDGVVVVRFFGLVRGWDDDLVPIGVRVGRDYFFPAVSFASSQRLGCKT